MKKSMITIEWHPLTEKPKKEGRYLLAEVIFYTSPRTGAPETRIEINERKFGKRYWWYTHGFAYAWAEIPKIEPPKPPKMEVK